MRILDFLVQLLLEARAHIPNHDRSGSSPGHPAYRTPLIPVIAAFLVTVAFLSATLWLAVRLALELL